MCTLPPLMKENLLKAQLKELEDWWTTLNIEQQTILQTLYTEDVEQQKLKIEFCGRFVQDDEIEDKAFWKVGGLYQYLINHELYFEQWEHYVGGICSAHPKALEVAQEGVLKSDFTCPLKDKNCPMLKLLRLNPGKSLEFYAKAFPNVKK